MNIVVGSKVSWRELVYSKNGSSVMKYFSGVVIKDLYDKNKTHWLIIRLKNKKKVRKRAKTIYLNATIDNTHLSDTHINKEIVRKAITSGRGIDTIKKVWYHVIILKERRTHNGKRLCVSRSDWEID